MQVGAVGITPSLTIGGRVFTDLTNLIILHGAVAAGQANCSLRKANGVAGYAVTAGKTLTIYACKGRSNTAANTKIILLYSDNDMGVDTATAPTNPVYIMGSTANYGLTYSGGASVDQEQAHEINFQVPATKIPGVIMVSSVSYFRAYGYEA